MSLTSFAVPCPCRVCKGKKLQMLVYVGPGQWVCPASNLSFHNLTVRDRAARRHAAYIRKPK